jgi:hypothetical protein
VSFGHLSIGLDHIFSASDTTVFWYIHCGKDKSPLETVLLDYSYLDAIAIELKESACATTVFNYKRHVITRNLSCFILISWALFLHFMRTE